ncbi:hypothetical protein C7377_1555 [Balneicella halophila]|uniref:Uncharacterized protein n=1 Tax=Balneicella halophila TaxID=1537566 RepID=A0A7L4UMR2_BALHA|nr:hypothetical protein [Balneicella halophila]PVX49916.1 hypothetical protein C7377_1555 [Balneicella halophila]
MKRILLILVTICITTTIWAQTGFNLRDLVENVENERYINGEFMKDRYGDIKGSPYNDEYFVLGSITMKNGDTYDAIPLRYNIFDDAIEFVKDKKVYQVPNPENISRVNFNGKTYVYAPYEYKNELKNTFFLLHNAGEAQLLEKEQVEFKEAEKPDVFKEAKPARFAKKNSDLYLKVGENSAREIKNKKGFLKLFPSHQEEIEKFVKQKKISTKDTDDLIEAIQYFNSISARN